MKIEKDYIKLKRNFIKMQALNNDNVYTYFNENQVKVIRKYYEVYTKYLFNKLVGSLRLEVSPLKRDKLVELKGVGTWEFAGMIDMLKRGNAFCELGHPLRYVYSARNIENQELLHFGSRCVGDFFDLDSNSLNALIKVKDEMFIELKEMVAIKEQNLYDEHYIYDCKEIGLIYKTVGLEGVSQLIKLNPLMPIVVDFFNNSLPLPHSLLIEILKFKSDLLLKLEDRDFLGIDSDRLKKLKDSKLTLISNMFTFSEEDILNNIKKGNIYEVNSDFYNFRKISDINVAVCVWENRNDRLLKAQSYFKKMGVLTDWLRVYRYMIQNNFKRDNVMLNYGVEILLLFNMDIVLEHSFYMPKDYNYKGYKLNSNTYEIFDTIIDYMATKDFIMSLKEITNILQEEDKKILSRNEEIEEMMNYLKSNLLKETYNNLRGIAGVIDIVLNKKLEFDNMTEKQQKYVENTYLNMLEIDKKSVEDTTTEKSIDTDINNRYKLIEKPEILAKIQRLQKEADSELTDFIKGILNNVMTYRYVSDKQIKYIDDAYTIHILKEELEDTNNTIKKSIGVKKWNLIERSDIKDKIMELQKHPEYTNIPSGVRNIFINILKYNSVSERQIATVENTYSRYYKGRHFESY